jgi:predicted nucleic acid-binding protein
LFGLKNVHLDHPQRVAEAISWHETELDFADAFHLAQNQQYSAFKTFDERLIKRAPLQSRCPVEKP